MLQRGEDRALAGEALDQAGTPPRTVRQLQGQPGALPASRRRLGEPHGGMRSPIAELAAAAGTADSARRCDRQLQATARSRRSRPSAACAAADGPDRSAHRHATAAPAGVPRAPRARPARRRARHRVPTAAGRAPRRAVGAARPTAPAANESCFRLMRAWIPQCLTATGVPRRGRAEPCCQSRPHGAVGHPEHRRRSRGRSERGEEAHLTPPAPCAGRHVAGPRALR